tara:strand:+ start:17064 stop:18686 length:1623 start_codon:yes stop_codon:yes gene_type:complete
MLMSGCAYEPKLPHYEDIAYAHILRVNRDGAVIDSNITTNSIKDRVQSKPWPINKVNEQADNMIIGALKLACKKAKKNCDALNKIISLNEIDNDLLEASIGNAPINIMMFVHGGLNTYEYTDNRLDIDDEYDEDDRNVNEILAGREDEKGNNLDWHYPIYISWPSNFLGTYTDHLFNIREGREINPYSAAFSFPFVLTEDLIQTIAEFPSNVYFQTLNDWDRFASAWDQKIMTSIWQEASNKYKEKFGYGNEFETDKYYQDMMGTIKVNRSIYCPNGWSNTTGFYVFLTSPIRYVIGSIYNGTLASNSWSMMKRRAINIAYPAGEFDENAREDGEYGDIGILFEKFSKMEDSFGNLNVNISLIGHSMGTIVLNNLMSRYQKQFEKTNWLSNIVYMAAAANIEDTLAIVPNILRNNPDNINFYNLTLNRVSEVAEINMAGLLAGSGSLLISIDKYHDEPEHYLRRTMGSEVNIHSAINVVMDAFKGIDDSVTLKSFNSTYDSKPQKHGHFGGEKFWEKTFWEIEDAPFGLSSSEQVNCDTI